MSDNQQLISQYQELNLLGAVILVGILIVIIWYTQWSKDRKPDPIKKGLGTDILSDEEYDQLIADGDQINDVK